MQFEVVQDSKYPPSEILQDEVKQWKGCEIKIWLI